jgi:hypothetical protein
MSVQRLTMYSIAPPPPGEITPVRLNALAPSFIRQKRPQRVAWRSIALAADISSYEEGCAAWHRRPSE